MKLSSSKIASQEDIDGMEPMKFGSKIEASKNMPKIHKEYEQQIIPMVFEDTHRSFKSFLWGVLSLILSSLTCTFFAPGGIAFEGQITGMYWHVMSRSVV